MATGTITANLNGGDSVTADDNLVFNIYGSTDGYTTPIHTTGAASVDDDVTIVDDVVTIENVDVGVETDFKISSVDQAVNESELSDAYSIAEADLVDELGADLLVWLKDSTDVENLTNDGTKASAWLDASGNNRNAVQATGTKQPLLDAKGLLFDGDDDGMTVTISLTAFEIYFVWAAVSATATDRLFDFAGSSRVIIKQVNSNTINLYSYINSANVNDSGGYVLDTLSVTGVIVDNASSSINGNALDIGGVGNMTSFVLANRPEGTAGGNIILKEVVVTNLLDSSKRTAVINRLNSLL